MLDIIVVEHAAPNETILIRTKVRDDCTLVLASSSFVATSCKLVYFLSQSLYLGVPCAALFCAPGANAGW